MPLPPLSHPLSCCSPHVPNVFDALDLVSGDEVPIPCPHVPPPQRPSADAAAASLADSDDYVHVPCNPARSALVSWDSDDEVLIPHPMPSCPSSTSGPIVGPHSAPQVSGHA
jgi:hypothetical protein